MNWLFFEGRVFLVPANDLWVQPAPEDSVLRAARVGLKRAWRAKRSNGTALPCATTDAHFTRHLPLLPGETSDGPIEARLLGVLESLNAKGHWTCCHS